MDQGSDLYVLDLTNDQSESTLDADSPSSASNFNVLLSPTLDLSSLLYLRSVAAEIALAQLTVDALPLTATKHESITVRVDIPPDHTNCNSWFNPISIIDENDILFEIPCRDFYTDDPAMIVEYTNAVLQDSVTQYILYRYLCVVLDVNIFKSGSLHALSTTDLSLVNRYIDIAIFTRNIQHDTMIQLLPPDHGFEDIPNRTAMTLDRDGMNRTDEQRYVTNSPEVFRAVEARQWSDRKTIDYNKFFGVNFGRGVEAGVTEAVKSDTQRWLTTDKLLARDPETNTLGVVPEKVAEVTGLVRANQALTRIGLKCREIISNLKTLLDKRKTKEKKTNLFVYCFLSLLLDSDTKLKCRFHIEKDKYITDGTAVTVFFPDQISYVLGSKSNHRVTVGPVRNATPAINTPVLTHNILSDNQQLFHALRPLPQVIHVVTDLVFSKSRDMWLADTPWRNYHLIYTFVLNQSNISRHYICQINHNKTFYRVQDVSTILESFSFVLLDQSFRRVVFSPYCRVALRLLIRPVAYGSQ